jgi:hypothetical protein
MRTVTNNAIPQNLAAARNAINTGTSVSLNTMTSQFGSHHPGGCHFSMADASVRFVSQDIALDVYQTAAIINDGLPMGGL